MRATRSVWPVGTAIVISVLSACALVPGRFNATARTIAVTEAQCRATYANPECPTSATPEQCPDYVRHSWFAVTVHNSGGRPAWVVDCTIVGLDGSRREVFRSAVHTGTYMGGIEVQPGHDFEFQAFAYSPQKAPMSTKSFTVACPAVTYSPGGMPT